MALEGLAAVSLVANIIQFVDFGFQLFSQSRVLYRSAGGSAAVNQDIETIANSLRHMSQNLTLHNGNENNLSATGMNVLAVANSCRMLAEELLAALEQIRFRSSKTKWSCFRVALRQIWNITKIEKTSRRLEAASVQLLICMVSIMNETQTKMGSLMQSIPDNTRRIELDMNTKLEILTQTTLDLAQKWGHASIQRSGNAREETAYPYLISPRLAECPLTMRFPMDSTDRLKEMRIVDSLRHEEIEMTRNYISDAYMDTLEWGFDPITDESPIKYDLLDWLANSGGTFWVSGTPGCGKSTLIKFLSNHPATMQALRVWAGNQRLVTAAYYFSYRGSRFNRSHEGLVQSLLFTILSQCPVLMPIALPRRWHECGRYQSNKDDWTGSELIEAFTKLSRHTRFTTRFCFFIDGLDEYEGDPPEILRFVQQMTKFKDIKVCMLSRPSRVFGDALE